MTHSEHGFELNHCSILVDPTFLQSRIILLGRYHHCKTTLRAFQLTGSESCLEFPYIKLGLGGPGRWRNGEVALLYMKVDIL